MALVNLHAKGKLLALPCAHNLVNQTEKRPAKGKRTSLPEHPSKFYFVYGHSLTHSSGLAPSLTL
jgi:hypothetical protein